jgi:hypothetical protein
MFFDNTPRPAERAPRGYLGREKTTRTEHAALRCQALPPGRSAQAPGSLEWFSRKPQVFPGLRRLRQHALLAEKLARTHNSDRGIVPGFGRLPVRAVESLRLLSAAITRVSPTAGPVLPSVGLSHSMLHVVLCALLRSDSH